AIHLEIAIQNGRRGEEAEPVRALHEQAIQKDVVETLGRGQRVRDTLGRVLIEVEARGAEGQVEVRDDDVFIHAGGNAPADIVRDGAGTRTPFGTDEGNGAADGRCIGVDIEARNRLDDTHRMKRG